VARVEFERVTKDFHGGVRAVDCLDLEIDDGKCMVSSARPPKGFKTPVPPANRAIAEEVPTSRGLVVEVGSIAER
jgi:hypothetical protein